MLDRVLKHLILNTINYLRNSFQKPKYILTIILHSVIILFGGTIYDEDDNESFFRWNYHYEKHDAQLNTKTNGHFTENKTSTMQGEIQLRAKFQIVMVSWSRFMIYYNTFNQVIAM